MPNFQRDSFHAQDDLDIATRIMDTVQKQVTSYRSALQSLREVRQEISSGQLRDHTVSTPQELASLLQERGVPRPLSVAMAAEDYQDSSFEAAEGFWTWDCCCTACCLTGCTGTIITGCGQTVVAQ